MVNFEPVKLAGKKLVMIDQRLLPNRYVKNTYRTAKTTWHAIRDMVVRGAPAIGIAGAYGLYLGLLESKPRTVAQARKALVQKGTFLKTARPTAVNLAWAIDRIIAQTKKFQGPNVSLFIRAVRDEAVKIHKEDQALCRAIGRSGERLIRSGDQVLVHCNAGGLATSGYGTALAVLYMAQENGKKFKVFATETRPLLQGARLTMWELTQAHIPATLICDSVAGMLMREKKIKAVIVGADRIARNGDTANKIGTYSLALLARAHGIPLYIAAPSSTFDFSLSNGDQIPIEERSDSEVTEGFGRRTAPKGARVYNPAFDVTPHHLIRGFITEKGILTPRLFSSLPCARRFTAAAYQNRRARPGSKKSAITFP